MILLFAVKLHPEGHLYIQVTIIGEDIRKETRPAKWEKALYTYATCVPVPVPYLNEKEAENVNLKGFMVGNPETDDGYDWRGNMDYAWSHGIISMRPTISSHPTAISSATIHGTTSNAKRH